MAFARWYLIGYQCVFCSRTIAFCGMDACVLCVGGPYYASISITWICIMSDSVMYTHPSVTYRRISP